MAERMEKAIEDTDDPLARRVEREVREGSLPKDFPSRDRARLMLDMRQGYLCRGRAGWSGHKLLRDLDDRVAMIFASPG